jgi:hypothetical protein
MISNELGKHARAVEEETKIVIKFADLISPVLARSMAALDDAIREDRRRHPSRYSVRDFLSAAEDWIRRLERAWRGGER